MNKLDELTEKLEADLSWRKKEVSNLVLLVNADNEHIIIKASILLIYSHWEGYVKNACKLYLSYVSNKKINLNDLSLNFEAIQLKGQIQSVQDSCETLTMANEILLLESIYSVKPKIFQLASSVNDDKDKSVINTKDNLKMKVFSSFLKIVGINERPCITSRKKYIDAKLLNNRNKIAHGNKVDGDEEDFDIDTDELKLIKDFVFTIMETLKDDLVYYSENELFLDRHRKKALAYNELSNTKLQDIFKKELGILDA